MWNSVPWANTVQYPEAKLVLIFLLIPLRPLDVTPKSNTSPNYWSNPHGLLEYRVKYSLKMIDKDFNKTVPKWVHTKSFKFSRILNDDLAILWIQCHTNLWHIQQTHKNMGTNTKLVSFRNHCYHHTLILSMTDLHLQITLQYTNIFNTF